MKRLMVGTGEGPITFLERWYRISGEFVVYGDIDSFDGQLRELNHQHKSGKIHGVPVVEFERFLLRTAAAGLYASLLLLAGIPLYLKRLRRNRRPAARYAWRPDGSLDGGCLCDECRAEMSTQEH